MLEGLFDADRWSTTFQNMGPFWEGFGVTLQVVVAGLLLSLVLGTLLGALLAALTFACPWADLLFSPVIRMIRAVPVVSFIILALVWVNSRSLSVLISGLMVFPAVYGNVLTGIGQADRQLLEMARVFRVPPGRQAVGIYLPAVLPYFRSACALGLGLCWKAGIAAEVIGLPGGSLGERLYTAKVYFQTADLFAWTAVIVAASVVFEKLFLRAVDALTGKVGGL